MRIQLVGEEAPHIIGPQFREFEDTAGVFMQQQPARDTNPVSARPRRQPSYIAQMFIVSSVRQPLPLAEL